MGAPRVPVRGDGSSAGAAIVATRRCADQPSYTYYRRVSGWWWCPRLIGSSSRHVASSCTSTSWTRRRSRSPTGPGRTRSLSVPINCSVQGGTQAGGGVGTRDRELPLVQGNQELMYPDILPMAQPFQPSSHLLVGPRPQPTCPGAAGSTPRRTAAAAVPASFCTSRVLDVRPCHGANLPRFHDSLTRSTATWNKVARPHSLTAMQSFNNGAGSPTVAGPVPSKSIVTAALHHTGHTGTVGAWARLGQPGGPTYGWSWGPPPPVHVAHDGWCVGQGCWVCRRHSTVCKGSTHDH